MRRCCGCAAGIALAGFERLAALGEQTDYAQTWLCEEPSGEL
jgi:hypothetical protein